MTGLPPELLELLICPMCRGEVTEHLDPHELVCSECGRRYPVRDGVPVMLPDEGSIEADSE